MVAESLGLSRYSTRTCSERLRLVGTSPVVCHDGFRWRKKMRHPGLPTTPTISEIIGGGLIGVSLIFFSHWEYGKAELRHMPRNDGDCTGGAYL